ncbi:MAG TPA: sulfotransferase [Rudaea sp.]|nr:sulfotransferase [Rudaea sp.]
MSSSADRLWLRAQRYVSQNQSDAARITLESLLARDPAHVRAHLLLGGIAWREDRIRDAAVCAQAAGRCCPSEPDLMCDVIAALIQVGEVLMARSAIAKIADTHNGPVLVRLAGQLQMLGEHEYALRLLDRAAAAGIAGPDFHGYRGAQRAFNGDLDGAERDLGLCVTANPAAGRTALLLSRLRRQTSARNHLAALEKGIALSAQRSEDRAALEFARYKEFEDLGRYDDAWNALSSANATMHALAPHDSARERAQFDALIEICTDAFLCSGEVRHEGPHPIFVMGLPRSGTTLLERILGNHSQVAAAGELGDFGKQVCWSADHVCALLPDAAMQSRLPKLDYAELGARYLEQTQWRAGGKTFYVDKLPAHWLVAGLIRKALPQARILHLTRDAMDVCFSNLRAMFGLSYPYSYDPIALASHYVQYRRLMAHWHEAMPGQILDVSYRDLVHYPEATAKSVVNFCGLDYEPECVVRTNKNAAVATLSMAQVREPIHQRAFEEWRPYEKYLAPLFAELQRAGFA